MKVNYIEYKQRHRMINRNQDTEDIQKLISLFPITAISGARQCGKTTWAQTFSCDYYFDLENPVDLAKPDQPQLLNIIYNPAGNHFFYTNNTVQ
jgi:predicted AAA+ superfamily ATPase